MTLAALDCRQWRVGLAMRSWIGLFLFTLLSGVLVANGTTLVLPERPTSEEKGFGMALTNAIETTNIPALVALHYCENDEPWAVEWFFRNLLKKPIDEVRIERSETADAPARTEVERMARANLPFRWIVSLRQPPLPYEATYTNTILLPAGQHDGRMVITRRMAVFTPFHKKLILIAVGFSVLMGLRYLWEFSRGIWSDARPVRYTPLGVAVLLLLCALDFAAMGFGMYAFADSPLRMFVLPGTGALCLVATMIYDDVRRQAVGTGDGSPLTAIKRKLAVVRKAWDKTPPTRKGVILAGVVLVFGWFIGLDVARGIVISVHSRHIQGTVIDAGGGEGVHYCYTVRGHEYFGHGVGDSDRIYPPGAPVDVRYSTLLPGVSAIDDPFLKLKQLTVGVLFFAGLFWLANRKVDHKRRRLAC